MKKIFMLLLCAVSLVSFTACSNLPFGVGGLGKNAKNESGENPSDYECLFNECRWKELHTCRG